MSQDNSKERFVFELSDKKMVALTMSAFDGEVDIDEYLKIRYDNIVGELLTFPLAMNRIARLKSEVEAIQDEANLDMKILEAQKGKDIRSRLQKEKAKTETGGKKAPTLDEIAYEMRLDEEWQDRQRLLLDISKQVKIIEGIYWSAVEKSKKLEALGKGIKPEDYDGELLEGTVNGIMIKLRQKSIK